MKLNSIHPDDSSRVPIDVYAHVRAALAEEFRLRDVLDFEGVEPAAWTAADLAWKTRLAADANEFARFEQELILAEDWLDRDVAPLREDVAAWTAFLDAYLSSPSRFDFVTELGLRMSDVARLQRRWARRMKADRAIEKQATELRKRPLVLPAIRVVASTLKRSRNSKEIATAPVTAAAAPTGPLPALREARGIELRQFAAIVARIQVSPGDVEATLRRYGVASESDYREIERAFHEQFTTSPDLERDYRRLVAHHESRLRIAGTSLSVNVPRGPALPFAAPAAQPEATMQNRPLVAVRSRGVGTGTVEADPNALVVAERDVLPFGHLETPGPGRDDAEEEFDLSLLPLETYASLSGALASGESRDVAVARHGLTVQAFEILARAWAQRFQREPRLLEKFRELARSSAAAGRRGESQH